MKKLLILSTALLVFAACGGKDDADEVTESPDERDTSKTQEEILKEKQADNEKVLAKQQAAVDAGNPDMCNSLGDDNQKYACRYNIIANEAIKAKDPSLCDKIGQESFVNECKGLSFGEEEN